MGAPVLINGTRLLDGIFDSVLRVAAWLDRWLYSES